MLLPNNNNNENNPSSNRTLMEQERHCGDNGVDCLEKNVDSYDNGSDNSSEGDGGGVGGIEDENVLRQANYYNNTSNSDGKETTQSRTSIDGDMDN